MAKSIKVIFLEDSQNSLDGFFFRLRDAKDIEIVETFEFWDPFQSYMRLHATELQVAILDVKLYVSKENDSIYPIFSAIPELLNLNPALTILVISDHGGRALIQSALEVGATSYILKNDRDSMLNLEDIVKEVLDRDVFVPEKTREILKRNQSDEDLTLTMRQLEALSLMFSHPHLSQVKLAELMHVKHSTFRNLLSQSYVKLSVPNRHAAHEKLREMGLIPKAEQ